MFKKAAGTLLATLAAADINEDFHAVLHGEEGFRASHMEPLWMQFKDEFAEHSPVDLLDSEESTMLHFFNSVDRVIQHNSQADKTYTKGLNKFSAMSWDELEEYLHLAENQKNAEQNCSATRSSPLTESGNGSAPDAWNWQDHGGVSPVKDQGNCGSCWTFSTVGCLESAHLIKYGTLATYAEQQLVDCAGDFDNNGCNGGLPSHAFEYVYYAGGIASEKGYPYYAEDRKCTVESSDFILSVGQSVNITAGDEVELKEAVYQQPVSVAFQVVDDFSDYTSGVYTSTSCENGPQDVNHAVLAVGYGTTKGGMDYWVVKNSWGTSWGNKGFFNIERGVNMCGIADCNAHPKDVNELKTFDFWQ